MNFVSRFRSDSRLSSGRQLSGCALWWKRGRQGVAVVGIFALLGGLGYGWSQRHTFGPTLTAVIAQASGAVVEEITVAGVTYTSREDLLAALQLKKGAALVAFDTAAARARLEELPWVQAAAVARQLPNKVIVDVYEHQPLARVELAEDDIWIVNKAGDLLVPADGGFKSLPLLSGAGAGEAAAELFQALQSYPNFMAHVQQAVRQGERRWDLKFKSGVMVQLPEQDMPQALAWLQELEDKRHVLTLAGGIVDLRLNDRIRLRIPPEAETGAVLGETSWFEMNMNERLS